MQKKQLWTKDFLSISFSSFFIFIIFYMLMVTLPIYVTDELYGKGPDIGIIATIFILSAIVFRPFTGKWLDTIGPKKILIVGITIFLIGSILYFAVKSILLLVLLRIFHGIGFGIATTAMGGIVANVIPNERRGEGIGYYATFMNIAMVIGPFLGLTIIHSFGFHLLFVICSTFSILAFLCALLLKLPFKNENIIQKTSMIQSMSLHSFFEIKAVPIAIVAFALAFVYSGVLSFISIYARELNLVDASSFFFVVYAVFLLISRPFTGKWFDKYGENIVVYPSIVVFAFGVLLLSQTNSGIMLLLSGGLIGLGFGTIVSCFQSIAIQSSPSHRRGLATSTFFVLFDSGFAMGSFIIGILATTSSYAGIYFNCSIFALFCVSLYYFLHGRKTQIKVTITRKHFSA